MTTNQDCIAMGIDGGGTACRAALYRGATLLAEAVTGPANYSSDPIKTLENIRTVFQEVLASASLGHMNLSVHLGLAGVLPDTDTAPIRSGFPNCNVTISDDRLTTVVGALGTKPGIVVSVGTGSFAARQSRAGVDYLGGWGLQLGDQSSGAWLGKQLFTRCTLVADGLAPASDLTDSVLAEFQNTPSKMIAFAATASPSDYAKYARRIVDSAEAGDAAAETLMQTGARYLNTCLDTLSEEAEPICLTGSLGPRYASYLRPEFQKRIMEPKGGALDGAVQLAQRKHQIGT